MNKEKFYWVWRNSKRENILNQFYYEHYDLLEALKRIDNAIEYTKTTLKFARLEKDFEKEKILLNFLEILGDKENE